MRTRLAMLMLALVWAFPSGSLWADRGDNNDGGAPEQSMFTPSELDWSANLQPLNMTAPAMCGERNKTTPA